LPQSDQDAQHTLHELVLGAYVVGQGFDPQYEPKIDGQIPEWLMVQHGSGNKLILELMSFRAPDQVERDVQAAFSRNEPITYWMEPNEKRLHGKVWDKIGKYRDLAEKHDLHYIVAVYGLFLADLRSSELRACLEGDEGLFRQYPSVTGLVHFQAGVDAYRFEYKSNTHAVRKEMGLKDGSLPVKRVE
jgi:hypothetical protein